ncbi:conserved hypothetical protein [Gammaproteobacteria bacterium]
MNREFSGLMNRGWTEVKSVTAKLQLACTLPNFAISAPVRCLQQQRGKIIVSGEVVLVSSVLGPLGALGALAGIAAATVAANAVNTFLERRRTEAARSAAMEQEHLAVWLDFQADQAQRMSIAQENMTVFRNQLSALRLADPETAVQADNKMPTRGFLVAEADTGLNILGEWFASLPAVLRADADFPAAILEAQWRRLQTQATRGVPPSAATVAAFRTALEQTLVTHLERLDRERTLHATRLTRARDLLEQTLRCQHALVASGDEETLISQLTSLHDDLLTHLATGEIMAGRLETLEHQGALLSVAVDTVLERAALRATLRDRIAIHLGELGYTRTMNEENGGQWRIPSGEQVRLKIQRDHRLAFQVIHERPSGISGSLNTIEQIRLRTQEARWCADAKELLRRLIRDGFAYSLQFERALPLDSIPVVVMESADELADEEEECVRYSKSLYG